MIDLFFIAANTNGEHKSHLPVAFGMHWMKTLSSPFGGCLLSIFVIIAPFVFREG